MGHAPQEGIRTRLQTGLGGTGAYTKDVLFQETLVDLTTVSFVQASDHKSKLKILKSAHTDFHGIPEFTGEEKESSCVLKPLHPKKSKGILEGGLLPPFRGEVVSKEGHHLVVGDSLEESLHEGLFLHGQVEEAGVQRLLILHKLGLGKLQKFKVKTNGDNNYFFHTESTDLQGQ